MFLSSPKQGSVADLDDYDDNVDLSFDLNPPQTQQIKNEITETVDDKLEEDNDFTYNCSPTSTMMPIRAVPTDTDTSSLTNRTGQIISSTTNQHQSETSPVASDDDYAESSESETEEPTNQETEDSHSLPNMQHPKQQQCLAMEEPDDRKRKFSVFGKFVCEELISLESDEAELLYTRILSEVLNFRVRKQMRSSL
jgi:hypothetical protein